MSRLRAQPVEPEPAAEVANITTDELPSYVAEEPDFAPPSVTDKPTELGIEVIAKPVSEQPDRRQGLRFSREGVYLPDGIITLGRLSMGATLGGVVGVIAKKTGLESGDYGVGYLSGLIASAYTIGASRGRSTKKTK
jgi:hypothetical protein